MVCQGLLLVGVVSFYGVFGIVILVSKGSVKVKILVEYGSVDSLVLVKDFDVLKQELNVVGVDYWVVIQDDVKYGFINFDVDVYKGYGLDIGYDCQVDQCFWVDLQVFFKDIFGQG